MMKIQPQRTQYSDLTYPSLTYNIENIGGSDYKKYTNLKEDQFMPFPPI